MQTGPTQLHVLIFELAGRTCAFALVDVEEVLRAVAIEPLPAAPPIVEGVINRRGTLVPVLDAAARFGFERSAARASDQLIVLRAEMTVAVRVSRAVTIREVTLAPGEPQRGLPPGVVHVAGFALVPDGVLVVLDLRAFLSHEEAGALHHALSDAARQQEVPA
jgi:purine-binding chemotaxis protein CheW